MSQPKQYEAASIEEALRAVSIDLGDDIEIVSAVKERRGGVFGFFAKERFVVTAQNPTLEVDEDGAAAFGELLLSLTDGVEDTWESSIPIETDPQPEPVAEEPAPIVARAESVIDLRSGKRTVRSVEPAPMAPAPAPAPATTPTETFSFGSERPSQLRRRIRAAGLADAPQPDPILEPEPEPEIVLDEPMVRPEDATVLAVAGPLHGLSDSAPEWSLTALRELGLPIDLLETVQEFDPVSDIEWMHAIAIAIDRMMPEDEHGASWVVGEGRGSAVELIRGIPFGRLPAALIVPGRKIRATPDELALALREILR